MSTLAILVAIIRAAGQPAPANHCNDVQVAAFPPECAPTVTLCGVEWPLNAEGADGFRFAHAQVSPEVNLMIAPLQSGVTALFIHRKTGRPLKLDHCPS